MATRALIATCVLAAVGVSGCETFNTEENAGPCPRAYALYEAARVVEFVDGEERFDSVGFTAEIQDVRTTCRYINDNPIVASIEMDIGFGRGPSAAGREATYTYFLAVTRRDMAVIDKQVFPITVRFDRNEDRVFLRESIDRIEIPRADSGVSGGNFELIVGFELTEAQLDFNRQGKRFLVTAGR